MKAKTIIPYLVTLAFLTYCIVNIGMDKEIGTVLLESYWSYVKFILAIMPAVFIMIGLLKVWVSKDTVSRHLGEASGVKGIVLAILLSFTCIGGLFTALPVARELYDKGTRVSVVLVYLGASSVCRIPMTLFEASLLGVKFTIIRYLVSIPLIIATSILLEKLIDTNKIKESVE